MARNKKVIRNSADIVECKLDIARYYSFLIDKVSHSKKKGEELSYEQLAQIREYKIKRDWFREEAGRYSMMAARVVVINP